MPHRNNDFVRVCRGLSHELSNVLTYLLPALAELEDCNRELLPALQHLKEDPQESLEALRRLAAVLPGDDLTRLGRQLQLGGGRLQQLFRDLRLGFVMPSRDQLRPVDLGAALREAALRAPGPPPIELLDQAAQEGAALWVSADPQLLGEALGRFARAAVVWAQVAPAAVRLTLRRDGERALCEALVAGDPAQLPSPEGLLEMLCPSESGAVRAERGPLGVLAAAHLLRAHGGALTARRDPGGVVLCAELPLLPGTAAVSR